MSWRSQLRTDSPDSVLALVQRKAERSAVVTLTRPIAWTREDFAAFLERHAQLGAWTYTLSTTQRGVHVATLRVRRHDAP